MLALVRIAWKFFGNRPFPVSRYLSGTILLLGASVVIAFSATMYIYPVFNLQGVLNMSFSMEIPGKGIDFFILPILVVLGGLVITGIKNSLLRFSIIPILMLLVILPSQPLLSSVVKYFEQTAQTSLYARAQEQVYFAAYGYFESWDGDARSPVSGKNLPFIDHLKKLISTGDITVRDTIVHISVEQDPWKALPFWVMTGIDQTLLLVERNPDDIFTAFGRLYDFPASLDLASPPKWLLMEQAVDYTKYREVSKFIRTRYTVDFSNDRIILFRLM
jgi:hypothetical protein